MEQRVRVVVRSADRFSMVGLTSLLQDRPEITLVTAEQRARADVVVVAADELTVKVVTELRQAATRKPLPVVLVLNEISWANADTMAKCRVVAILPSTAMTQDLLLRNVLAAAAGQNTTPPTPVRHERQRNDKPASSDSGLTTREIDILRLMADGLDTASIASTLAYSERTVKNIFYNVTNRLNLRNRPHAVAYALREGLI